MRIARCQRDAASPVLDLDHMPLEAESSRALDAPLGLPSVRQLSTLFASGGAAGYWNLQLQSNPSPKFATRN
jgi:hypothetical protein